MQKSKKTKAQLIAQCESLETRLTQALDEAGRHRRELTALTAGARAVLEEKGFVEAARAIFDHCRDLIGATSGYVALLREDGAENEVLFLEAGGLPCDVDPDLPMPIRGLRAEAYNANQAVYHNDFMHSEWVKFMPKGHVVMRNVLFAPLVLSGRTVGVIGLANKPADFNDNDARMAAHFGELAAIALQNSRERDRRREIEQAQVRLIHELNSALAQVKTLSGMLPVCSWCKKVRDDAGYWTQLEAYLQEHAQVVVSHSICPACLAERYPDEKE